MTLASNIKRAVSPPIPCTRRVVECQFQTPATPMFGIRDPQSCRRRKARWLFGYSTGRNKQSSGVPPCRKTSSRSPQSGSGRSTALSRTCLLGIHGNSETAEFHSLVRCNFVWPLVVRSCPRFVRVVAFHLREQLQRSWSKVFLIYDSFMVDNKGFDAGDTVIGRDGSQGEAPDHQPVDDKINFSGRCRCPIPLENFEIVPMKWFRLITGGRVTFLNCFRHSLRDRATRRTIVRDPIKPIAFAGCADDTFRVLGHSGAVADL